MNYEDLDGMIHMEQNENEGQDFLPTLEHLGQEMNPLEQEIDPFWHDNQNEVVRSIMSAWLIFYVFLGTARS